MVAMRNGKRSHFNDGKNPELPKNFSKNKAILASGRLGVGGSNPLAPTKFINNFKAFFGRPVYVGPPVSIRFTILFAGCSWQRRLKTRANRERDSRCPARDGPAVARRAVDFLFSYDPYRATRAVGEGEASAILVTYLSAQAICPILLEWSNVHNTSA
jgi:hypothetical protein